MGSFETAKDKQAEASHAIDVENEDLETAVDAAKRILRYAENETDFDDSKLKYLGWGARRPASALAPPGQTRSLEAPAGARVGSSWTGRPRTKAARSRPIKSSAARKAPRTGSTGRHRHRNRGDRQRPAGRQAVRVPGGATIDEAGEGEPSNGIPAVL
ncbi:MAG: hypothetical protein BECKG1743D_GA0114223_103268 [Candidatus Kentron sp. G]|nr:MAG: hypothetical protein BECKG1743E_GA0114224_103847 [Candidatus Kentron sp. G]VFN01994.1 MAG: hypothetical protein BECKG1743D_GA0114223_103268 [Candidatus Kentron sp. G]VFN04136.1 MAG: hypothetical protein BECKG1743F_GA0114225_108913 [Candidatus Kentron sp. G]